MRKKAMSVILAFLTTTGLMPFACSAESADMEEPQPSLSEFETQNVYWIYYKAPDTSKYEEEAEQKRRAYIYELYQSGATENEVQQKSTEYYQELRLDYLKKVYEETANQILIAIGVDPSKAWCSSYSSTIVCELNEEQLAKARMSEFITDISDYSQEDLNPDTNIPTSNESKEFIDLLTRDENGNSVLSSDIKVSSVLNCSINPNTNNNIDYLVIYGISSIKDIPKVIDSLNKQTKFNWENLIEDYNGCVYHLTSENNISNNTVSIIMFVDNEQLGFRKTSKTMFSSEVGFDVTPYLFYLGDTNGDFRVDATDASNILSLYSKLSTAPDYKTTDEEKKIMDVNLDGYVDASDASGILSYYSYLSTGGEKKLNDFLK